METNYYACIIIYSHREIVCSNMTTCFCLIPVTKRHPCSPLSQKHMQMYQYHRAPQKYRSQEGKEFEGDKNIVLGTF